MATTPRFDLRRGVTEPVVLVISRRQVETIDIASVLTELKPFLATREEPAPTSVRSTKRPWKYTRSKQPGQFGRIYQLRLGPSWQWFLRHLRLYP